jgi:hypothetical protein
MVEIRTRKIIGNEIVGGLRMNYEVTDSVIEKSNVKNRIVSPIRTISVLTVIICFVLTARGFFEQTYEKSIISTMSVNAIADANEVSSHATKQIVHMDALIITVVMLLGLLGLCIIIAKKHQLFMKDVEYDGFDEERYA